MIDVVIIGGGLAGLTAANYLQQKNISYLLLEATDRVGGRVKTDLVDGYLLDRGFQVLLTAYPEAKRLLDYEKLNLQKFKPGAALLMPNGKIETIGDPLRDVSSLLPTLTSSAGNISDKLGILKMRSRLNDLSIEEIFSQKEKTTLEALQSDYGFSDKMTERFFRPFFSGIFLENNLATSRRMFDFVFKMFGEGHAAVPNEGMEAIPRQLAGNLPSENIRTNCKVELIEGNKVFINGGETIQAKNILLATEATSLIKDHLPKSNTRYVSTLHLHFISGTPALQQPLIGLNTLPKKLVNNICTINKVAPGYASGGKNLISISIVGKSGLKDKEIISAVRKELSHWFGKEVEGWEHLHSHLVEYALPVQNQVTHNIEDDSVRLSENLYVCGDHLSNGSIDAAMLSGRRAAEVIAKDLGAG
ncbi:MAG: NAD(P)/FAD-dependent oxidoreductase [Saprospiraceae bacterium]